MCPTLCNPMNCSWPGSSVHRIFQTRILEWVAISFSRRSSWSRDQTQVSRAEDRLFTIWANREAQKKQRLLNTKTSINSSTFLEIARPRKSIPTLCPKKGRNSHRSVNLKVGTWAPACSLLIQEALPNCLRLASLPLKSCSYCSPNRRCFKLSFGSKVTIFTSHQVKQLLNGKSHPLNKGCSDIK